MLKTFFKFWSLSVLLLACAGLAFGQRAAVRTGERVTKRQALDAFDPAASPRGARPVPPTILQVDVQNVVVYVGDVSFDKLVSNPGVTNVSPLPFSQSTGLGDVVGVNGKPARGLWMLRATPVLTTPTPGPGSGIAIADSARLAEVTQSVEIMKPDLTSIGTIMAAGPGFGANPPGSPLATHLSNNCVTGGTGAYLGARGQLGTTGLHPDAPVRFASASENPALRRVNGGGILNFIVHVIPYLAPEVIYLADYLPAVFHTSDQTLVTSANPAVAGEVLALTVKGLGPTIPNVDPGQPFPTTSVCIVNSPVEALVNGESAAVVFAGGEPGRVDIYDVEFRLPTNAKSGLANVQLISGFIKGAPFEISIQ
ncbi:MAG TPA: hypothetical protein VE398_26695 [Acidobacteriota bacterium]|nr:hypothetical protein [Acidobacteriota bacterium]